MSGEAQARLGLFTVYRAQGRRVWVQAGGTSMRPLIRAGDWLEMQFGAQPQRPGAVILLARGTLFIAHRVIRLDGDVLYLKGDAELRFDPPVDRDDVFGVVLRRRRDGRRARTAACSGLSSLLAAGVSTAVGRLAGRLHPPR